jgi:hypothetical protein
MWQTSRFECKYIIPPHRISALRQWMQMFIAPDPFAARQCGNTYTISSRYLDSGDLHLYRMTKKGIKNRFKLRIRTYSDDPSAPVFFEIKRRIDRVIRKSRVRLNPHEAREILHGCKHPSEVLKDLELHHLETFLELMRSLSARPVISVRYDREAYESLDGCRLRLTLDHDLVFTRLEDFTRPPRWENKCAVPMVGTLLEIKFSNHYPQWVGEMIRHFELQKTPYSKYCRSVDEMRVAPPNDSNAIRMG